jgi:hypothetical protein
MKPMTLSTVRIEDLNREFHGIRGMSEDELKSEVMRGGRFICYVFVFQL